MFAFYKVQKKNFSEIHNTICSLLCNSYQTFLLKCGVFPPTILDFQATKRRDYISDIHEYFTHINLFSNGKTNYLQLFIFTSFSLFLSSTAISPQLCYCREQLRTAVSCTAKTHITETYLRNKSSCQSCSFRGEKKSKTCTWNYSHITSQKQRIFHTPWMITVFLILTFGGRMSLYTLRKNWEWEEKMELHWTYLHVCTHFARR